MLLGLSGSQFPLNYMNMYFQNFFYCFLYSSVEYFCWFFVQNSRFCRKKVDFQVIEAKYLSPLKFSIKLALGGRK